MDGCMTVDMVIMDLIEEQKSVLDEDL